MSTRRAASLQWALLIVGTLAAPALPAQTLAMVLGQQVAARADAPAMVSTANPRSLYLLHCAGCHGASGAGAAAAGVPDMRRLGDFLRVPGGREFVIKVPGVMGSGLDDAQVAAVTNWLLAALAPASIPTEHKPFDAAEVARARATPLVDVAAARGHLVEQARTKGITLR
jgi:mono/diheme cytochrome c family protein